MLGVCRDQIISLYHTQSRVMFHQTCAIRKAIRPLFTDQLTYKKSNMSAEVVLKVLLIRPRICEALTAAFLQCKDGFKSLLHHTPRSFSSFTTSRSVDTFKLQSLMVHDAGSELPNSITLNLAALNLSNQILNSYIKFSISCCSLRLLSKLLITE